MQGTSLKDMQIHFSPWYDLLLDKIIIYKWRSWVNISSAFSTQYTEGQKTFERFL